MIRPARTTAASEAEKREGTVREARREADFSAVPTFSAAEIARALGNLSKQAVLSRLRDIPADGEKKVRGQSASAWRLDSLPQATRAELDAARFLPDGTIRFRTIEALIENMPSRYQPESPLADYSTAEMDLARLKAEVLAPLLHRRAKTRCPLQSVAAIAHAHFVNLPGGQPSRSTIEKWARTAETRDQGRGKFECVKLYLPETAPLSLRLAPQSAEILFPSLQAFLDGCSRPISAQARADLWAIAFRDFERAVARGGDEMETRRAAFALLAHPSSPLYPSSLDALRKGWERKFPVWQALDKDPDAIADARRHNAGRAAKFSLTRDEQLCLRAHHLERGSLALGVEWFVKGCSHKEHHAGCLPSTRKLILDELDRAALAGFTAARWLCHSGRAGGISRKKGCHPI